MCTENSLTTSQTLPFTIEAIEALLLLHNSREVKQSTRATNSTDQDRFYLVVAIETTGNCSGDERIPEHNPVVIFVSSRLDSLVFARSSVFTRQELVITVLSGYVGDNLIFLGADV